MRANEFIKDDYVYHGTAESLVPFIRHDGLDPEASSDSLTWFTKDPNEAQRYSEVHDHQFAGPKRKGTVLRVLKSNLPTDALQHLSYSDVTATAQHIPPEHIELKQSDGSWVKLVATLDESCSAQEQVHTNPTVGTLKALARNNPYGSVRFVIYKDGTLVAGDSIKFTHQDIAPAMGAWYLRGYVQHLEGDDYAYRTMEPYSNLTKDHPMLKRFERRGIQNGNHATNPHAIVESAPKTFYHGSMDPLPVSTILQPRSDYEQQWGSTDFYSVLEKYRPKNMLSHKQSVFMCDNADDIDLAGGGTEWLFTVEPLGPIQKHDINWSSEISMLVGDGYSIDSSDVKNAAEKYWAGVPHPDESVWEYLTPSAKIIAVEPY